MLPNMTKISFYQLSREHREEINQRSNSHSKGEKILLTFIHNYYVSILPFFYKAIKGIKLLIWRYCVKGFMQSILTISQPFCLLKTAFYYVQQIKTIIEKNSWPTTFWQVWIFSWARLYSVQILSNSFKEAGVVKHSSSNTCIASERSFPKWRLMLTHLYIKK